MSDDHAGEPPWEPPRAGTEVEHLLAALDRQRATFRWKADGLDAAGLGARLGPSALTLGGLLLHLAAVEAFDSTSKAFGTEMPPVWASLGRDGSNDWELRSASRFPPDELYALYDASVAESRDRFAASIAEGGLDQRIAVGDGSFSVRRLLFDLLEEYARHTGHADLLRESVDGRVGEDPPADWAS